MEVSDVRRRLRGAIEDARRRTAERRARVDAASRAWGQVLPSVVIPAFHALQSALTGESHRFKVSTPGEAARLTPERSTAEFIEIALDTERDLPAVMIRSLRGRGRRTVSAERIVREGDAIPQLTQEEIVTAVLEELVPLIER